MQRSESHSDVGPYSSTDSRDKCSHWRCLRCDQFSNDCISNIVSTELRYHLLCIPERSITVPRMSSSLSLVSTTPVALVLSSVSIGSQAGAPCSAYTTINDPTRSITQFGSSSRCDDGPLFNASNGGSWIRFVGTGGTIIPLSSAGMNRCGGFLTAWFNGTLPTVANVVSNQSVCVETDFTQCTWQTDVQVVLCTGNYFVYFLPPVRTCNTRYCTV